MISDACDWIEKSIDAFEAYSYQFNIKIIGMLLVAERESSEQTANLSATFHSTGSQGCIN